MSVDPTSNLSSNSYQPNTSGEREVNAQGLETLRSTFAGAIFSSLSRSVSQTDTILQATEPVDSADARQERDKDDRRTRDHYEDRDRLDRRRTDRSEFREEDLRSDYQKRLDRRERNRDDYERKTDRIDAVTAPENKSMSSTLATTVPGGAGQTGDRANRAELSLPRIVARTDTVVASHASATGSVPPNVSNTVSAARPGINAVSMNGNTAIPAAAAQAFQVSQGAVSHGQLGAASVLTIFTVSGRMEAERREIESRNASLDKKKDKKERLSSSFSTAVFEAFEQVRTGPALRPGEMNDHPESIPIQEVFSDLSGPNEEKSESESHRESGSEGFSLESFTKLETPEPTQTLPESTWDEEPASVLTNPDPTELIRETGIDAAERADLQSSQDEQMDRVRLIQRVAAACQSAANQNGTVRIKLNLDRLGTLTVRITSRENKLSVHFEPTSTVAARLLRDDLESLRSTLLERDLFLESVEIDVCERGNEEEQTPRKRCA